MEELKKKNFNKFIEDYNSLHDSSVLSIKYNIENSEIELLVKTLWTGDIVLTLDGTYKKSIKKIKFLFKDIVLCNFKELKSKYLIKEIVIEKIKIDNSYYPCFKSSKLNPLIYIVSKHIYYEEII